VRDPCRRGSLRLGTISPIDQVQAPAEPFPLRTRERKEVSVDGCGHEKVSTSVR
jgi:hypothetical protein